MRESNITEKHRIRVNYKQGVIVVKLLEENILKVDEAAVEEISNSLLWLAEKNAPAKMLLNFSRVEYLSSSMLGTLIRLKKRIVEGKGQFKLCCMHPAIYEMFKITQLNQILEIYEKEQEALGSFEW